MSDFVARGPFGPNCHGECADAFACIYELEQSEATNCVTCRVKIPISTSTITENGPKCGACQRV